MTMKCVPLTAAILGVVWDSLSDLERERTFNPGAFPPRGEAAEEWLKTVNPHYALGVSRDDAWIGYGLITAPSRDSMLSYVDVISMPSDAPAVTTRYLLETITQYVLRHCRAHKLIIEAVMDDDVQSAALAAGYSLECVYDEAVYFAGRYHDQVRLAMIRNDPQH